MYSAVNGREAIGDDLVSVVYSGGLVQHPSGSGRVEKRVEVRNTAAGNNKIVASITGVSV